MSIVLDALFLVGSLRFLSPISVALAAWLAALSPSQQESSLLVRTRECSRTQNFRLQLVPLDKRSLLSCRTTYTFRRHALPGGLSLSREATLSPDLIRLLKLFKVSTGLAEGPPAGCFDPRISWLLLCVMRYLRLWRFTTPHDTITRSAAAVAC